MSFFKLIFRFWQKVINGLFLVLLTVFLAFIYLILVIPFGLVARFRQSYKKGWIKAETIFSEEKLY